MKRTRPRAEDFTIGLICALPLEYAATKQILDDLYDESAEHTTGRIHDHEVVLTCLPAGRIGTNDAAIAVARMTSAFPSLKAGLLVGIAGGVPSVKADIRLGDVVISQPEGHYGGVVQYDLGKTTTGGSHQRTGSLNSPPSALLTAVSKLKSNLNVSRDKVRTHLSTIPDLPPRDVRSDVLFRPSYCHVEGDTCDACCRDMVVKRAPREDNDPFIFFGTIASGNQVIKDGVTRDQKSSELGGVLCFEMEAAGVMNQLPCLVIRGICDYADSHKNKVYQPLAAAAAAACARQILEYVSSTVYTTNDSTPARINHVQRSKSLSEVQKETYMDSLKFDRIHTRHSTIRIAHVKTCRWLLRSQKYREWLDPDRFGDHHGVLWIKGKPGAGKSTIMKFAFTNATRQHADAIIISFFFNARGTTPEKSISGMYRSLLLQVLKKFPESQDIFRLLPTTATYDQGFEWDVETLKFLFQSAVEKLRNRFIICYIDALDECDEDQVRDMLSFFEQIGELAISVQLRLHVCFSSRHYPRITIEKGLELVLDDQDGHHEDITAYVQSELKAGRSKQAEQVKHQVITRASGIFLWVVLVVQILNKEHDRGRIHALKKRLAEIPDELHELLKDILTRDNQNMECTLLCLQWILYSKRPLSREELYFAILGGTESDMSFLAEWAAGNITAEDTSGFILDCSKGLAEVTKSKNPTVQFIHESVRDFLRDEGLSSLDRNIGSISPGPGHDSLKKCCLRYVAIELPQDLSTRDPLPDDKSAKAKDRPQSDTGRVPFLEYAVNHVLYHADSASKHGFTQEAFLQTFPIRHWILKNNSFEQYKMRRYTTEASMLYILADKDFPNLIHGLDDNYFRIVEGERYGHPLKAAVMQGKTDSVSALLKHRSFATDYLAKRGRGLVSRAVHKGYSKILDLLLGHGANPNIKDQARLIPLFLACEQRKKEMVDILTSHGADLEIRDNSGRATLSYAVSSPLFSSTSSTSAEIVQLLLDRGADLESRDNTGRTALYYAVSSFSSEAVILVQLLLDRGADLESRDNSGRTALSYAVSSFSSEAVILVQLLLDRGADLESRDNSGRTILSYAVSSFSPEAVILVQLLLDRGADLESRDNSGRTILSHAVSSSFSLTVVQLLLDRGADLESRDNGGRTPISHAVSLSPCLLTSSTSAEIVQLLLDRGTDLESRDDCGRTPIQFAIDARNGHILRVLHFWRTRNRAFVSACASPIR